MRFLTALLTVLLVANASFLLAHSQFSSDEPESNEPPTDQPIYTDTDGPEYTTTGFDNGENGNFTDDFIIPPDAIIECSYGNTDNYYYLSNNYGYTDSYYNQYNSNSNRYLLKSPNFGYGDYGNNTSCKVKFYTGSTRQRLTVYFTAFDVETLTNCGFDYLCMGGVKFCSTWPQGRYFTYEIAPYSSFTFDFETDFSVAKSGFEASLTFDDVYTTYGSYEPTSGDGSNEDTVVYSYVDEYSYQDRCASDYYNTPTVYYAEPSTPEPRFDFEDSFVEAVKSQLDQAEDKINVAEELIDNLDSPQRPEYPQYPQYPQYRLYRK